MMYRFLEIPISLSLHSLRYSHIYWMLTKDGVGFLAETALFVSIYGEKWQPGQKQFELAEFMDG